MRFIIIFALSILGPALGIEIGVLLFRTVFGIAVVFDLIDMLLKINLHRKM